jgi:hypothetical protein
MESQHHVRIDAIPVNRESTMALDTPPAAGRRGAVRLLGLGAALLAALGLHGGAAAPEPQNSQAKPELIGKNKTRRGKRGRKGRQGKHGPQGPGGDPGGGGPEGPEGPEGPAGPSSGAFLGLVRDSKNVDVAAGTLGPMTLDCPAANPGEITVAVGGGFESQVAVENGVTKGFFITSNRPSSDTKWSVSGFNSASSDLTLIGYIVCARYTA